MCRTCKEDLPFDAFNCCIGGYDNQCKVCRKDEHVKRHWGISYTELVAIYGDTCNICGEDEIIVDKRTGKLHQLCIDHDHDHCIKGCRQCIRGLLCRRCNFKLDRMSMSWLKLATAYLELGGG